MVTRFSYLLRYYAVLMDFVSFNAVFFAARYLMRGHVDLNNADYAFFWMWLNAFWFFAGWLCQLFTEPMTISFNTFSRNTVHAYFYWLIFAIAYLFVSGQLHISRLFVTVIFLSHGCMLLLNRFLYLMTRSFIRQQHSLTRKAIIIGYNDTAKKLTHYLEDEEHLTEIVGYCESRENVQELTHYPVLAPLESAFQVSQAHQVDEIYSTIAPEHNNNIYQLMKEVEQACIRFRFIPDFNHFINRSFYLDYIKDIPVVMFRREPLENSANRFSKRLFDLCVSCFVLVFVLSWLAPLLGLLIWLESPGPVFFRQQRSGRNNKPFNCLKFRSMRISNDAHRKQATRNDSRITKIGRFIRKTSLDEFPQFFNVLKGEMSLVGPRPHMLKHTDEFSSQMDEYMVRHFAKPGITGWAQVNGYRGETSTFEQIQGRVKHDIWYLENWSLWLDLRIMFLTVYNIFKGEDNAF